MESTPLVPAAGQRDPVALLQEWVGQLRPRNPADLASATARLRAFTFMLEADPELRREVRDTLRSVLASRAAGTLYAALGILPSTGFFSETWRRIAQSILPDVHSPETDLSDVLLAVFDRQTDALWVSAVADEDWAALFAALHFEEASDPAALPAGLANLLDGLGQLSYRMAGIGTDPELLRLDPSLACLDSPFFAQNAETRALIASCLTRGQLPEAIEDEKQLMVLFDQCRAAVERIHRRAAQAGTSLRLTYMLRCLRDHIARGEQLAEIVGEVLRDPSGRGAHPQLVALFKTLVTASCHRNDLRSFWQQTLELTARRVTEYAGKAGEHYITASREEYFAMARAAMGAGLFIAVMAMFKLLLHRVHLAPLNEMLAYGLNYGLGFMLIYMLGFTVATKQPAMTANALAASIGEARGKVRDLENLITLIARTTRSQIVAIFGNIVVAIPSAILLSSLGFFFTGAHLLTPAEADALLAGHHPLASGALIYAGIAGVCLFLSGLIAGYVDNATTYHRIPARLRQLGWARRGLGETRLAALSDYIERHMGALAGNFIFGMLLGGAWGIGMLLGLPIDIRHVAFSSAYLGYAAAAYHFAPPLTPFLWAALGVLGIGFVNLAVSFSLALIVALRARGVTFSQGRQLLRGLLQRLRQRPGDFFLPPGKGVDDLVQ